jgi:hypothetical protein
MSSGKVVTSGNSGFTGGAPTQSSALFQKTRPRRPVNGAVNPTAPQKGRVGRIDNGIHGKRCDIALLDFHLVQNFSIHVMLSIYTFQHLPFNYQ